MNLRFRNNRLLLSLIIIPVFLLSLFLWTNAQTGDDIYKSISKNITLMRTIYEAVLFSYVDNVDSDKFFQSGITGMLSSLDPYTNYIEKENRSQLEILTEGNYGGVGLLLQLRGSTITVGDPPFVGTPAARAGIREGDQIIKIGSESCQELGFDQSASKIRGPVGTEVELTIKRAGEPKYLTFRLVREKITVEDVRFAGVLDGDIGYILLTRFSTNADEEVEKALREFKAQGVKGVILDLRSNPGGILESAVRISDLFLPKGDLVVSTKGRDHRSNRSELASRPPVYGEGPLVVLVNGFSASASEIVAGAIQDHDRGIVVGDTTFGKGLVQSLFPVSNDAVLKMTTAKYYTPSGRCIQRMNYSTWTDSSKQAETKAFHTDAGRLVHGGGGIAPDVLVTLPLLTDLAVDLRRKSHFFNFAVSYANTHTALEKDFSITDDIIGDFRTYLKNRGYHYEYPVESGLKKLQEDGQSKGYDPKLLQNINALLASFQTNEDKLFELSREDISQLLQFELTTKFFGVASAVKIGMKTDLVFLAAKNILQDKERYRSILHPEKEIR